MFPNPSLPPRPDPQANNSPVACSEKKRKYILPYTFSQAYYHLTLRDPQLVEAAEFGGGIGDGEDWLVV